MLLSPVFIVYHWYILGGIPTLSAFMNSNSFEIYEMRNHVTSGGTLVNYLYSFEIKAILPFLILYFFKTRSKWFYPFLILGTAYGLSLIMKSVIISVLMPIGIYCLFEKKYLVAGLVSLITLGGLMMLTFCANPALRGGDTYHANGQLLEPGKELKKETVFSSANKGFTGLQDRVIYIPGKTVAYWFMCIPKKAPFLYGDGYKPIAKLKGHSFVDYSTELYKFIYPDWYKQGYRGSVNCASFMYDYANFGNWGMILSGLILATLFYLIYLLNCYNLQASTSINFMNLLMVSSTSLTTLLFSGGWGMFIALFLLTKEKFK